MAFTYYPVGGLSTDPSKNCFTMNLPSEPSDIEIKQSSRPASSAMRQIYQKDSYKTSISTVKSNGKDYITNIPLISETSCASVDCSGSATTYYKLDNGSYDSAGNYTYNVLSSVVPHTLEGNTCVPGTAPSGYDEQLSTCSRTCFPTEGGPSHSVTGTVSGNTCVISDCHDGEQITDCSESTTYYKLDNGSYDGQGNYTYNVLSNVVPHTLEGNTCVPGTAPGYGAQPTVCSQTCFPMTGGPARLVRGTVSGTSCVMSNCHDKEQSSPSAPSTPTGGTAPTISGYTFDDGSAYGISSTDADLIYYSGKGRFFPHISSTDECANLCDSICDCVGFTYYTLGSSSLDPSHRCALQTLGENDKEELEIKLSTRPKTEALRKSYKKNAYKSNLEDFEETGGKKLLKNIPLLSETDCCPSFTHYYKLDTEASRYDGAGNLEIDVDEIYVRDTRSNGTCVTTEPPPGYSPGATKDSTFTTCTHTCYPDDGGNARVVTGSVNQRKCLLSNCYENRHCGSNTVYSRDSGTYDGEGNYVYNVLSSNIPRVDNGSGCVDGPIPSGYTETQPTCSQTCFPDNGTGQREVTGVLNTESPCVHWNCYMALRNTESECAFRNCYEQKQPCTYTTYATQTVDPNSFQKKTAWALRRHDGTKSAPIETIDVANQINANGECLPPTNIPAGAIDASTACSVTAQQQVCAESRSNNVAVAATGTITKNADGTSSCTLNNCYDYDPWWRCDIDACDAEMKWKLSRRHGFNSINIPECDNCPYRQFESMEYTYGPQSKCGLEEKMEEYYLLNPEERRYTQEYSSDWTSIPWPTVRRGLCQNYEEVIPLSSIGNWKIDESNPWHTPGYTLIGNWNDPSPSQMPVFYRPGMQEEAEALPTVP